MSAQSFRIFFRLAALACFLLARSGTAFSGDGLAGSGARELALYLELAQACEAAYDDSLPGLEQTPSGCVALVRRDKDGNLVIAFRGSMLGDRAPRHPFSNLGGAVVRRNWRDWAATNLKQATGFLPRQYVEAASLVEKHAGNHPVDKLVYVTGHSKGGGAATYAFAAAGLSPELSGRQLGRLRCVTFNAAVIRERNWRRLFRGRDAADGAAARLPARESVRALVMRDDPVSKLAASEERQYVRRIVVAPSGELPSFEQHGIGAVIRELERRLAATEAVRSRR